MSEPVSEPVSYDEYTVEELIDAAGELDDRVGTLFTRLAGITRTAHGDGIAAGIAATVNLEGRLIDLTLSAQAMTLTPDELAAEIFRLTQEASAEALAEGLDALTPVAGEDLTALLRAELDVDPPASPSPSTPPAPVADEDLSSVASWALPR